MNIVKPQYCNKLVHSIYCFLIRSIKNEIGKIIIQNWCILAKYKYPGFVSVCHWNIVNSIPYIAKMEPTGKNIGQTY